ncbi:MAG: methylhydantoinase [Rhodospirillaceae bacterium]|nr:methylhydantoinase [Rhodospirillaceae bacterium]OUT76515.1 MAG: methylhydantoinase [Rhodospirillaceae bacterium TMED23]
MSKANSSLDPITLEIIFNALRSVADETFITLMKSAYSTNIKERRDHSTAIMDKYGRLIVQADASLPVHLASMGGLMVSLLKKYKGNIFPGDIFIGNDPHVAGGTHLPDINMAMPLFFEGQLIAFMCNIAHHADVGGSVPGSMAGGMTEIFQEGIRLPVTRLFEAGELQADIMELILLNVRIPEERRGDYYAQIASCRLGTTRLSELIENYGITQLNNSFDEIIHRTKKRMKEAIIEIPDGIYEFSDIMDDDGMGTLEIPICVSIMVKNDYILFDFTGTADQVTGNINVTLNATQASVCYALKALLDPDVPNNQGVLDLPEIIVKKGSLLDAQFPAPVAARANTCQRIIDVILGALAKAKPEAAVAAANGANTTAVFSGVNPSTGVSYVYLETLGGGFGGRATKDGKDGVQVHITNTSNLPVEAIEMEYPLMVHSYKLIEDSGGAGRNRGGLGLERIIEPIKHDCTFNGAGERFENQPWGIFGGEDGKSGEFIKVDKSGKASRLNNKPIAIEVKENESIVIRTPGAGGYGPAKEREIKDISADAVNKKFSYNFLEKKYPQWKNGT